MLITKVEIPKSVELREHEIGQVCSQIMTHQAKVKKRKRWQERVLMMIKMILWWMKLWKHLLKGKTFSNCSKE